MATAQRQVFRAHALEQYVRSRERSVLPRFIGPRAFVHLWLILVILGAVGLLALSIRLPVYASGSAVVVDPTLAGFSKEDGPVVVAFIPAEHLERLEVGQSMVLQSGTGAPSFQVPIAAIEDDLSAPDRVQRRFQLSPGVALVANRPVAVAIGRATPDIEQSSPRTGAIYRVQMRVGSRPIMALVPLMGLLAVDW